MTLRAERFTAAFSRPLDTMSAKTFIRGAMLLIALAGSLGALGRWVTSHPTKAEVDSVFVRRDTFAIYQQGLAAKLREDSITRTQDLRDILHAVQGVDSSVKCLRNVPGYCR